MTRNFLTETIAADTAPPAQRRPLRLGIVGGGRIAATQAMAARMTGRYEIVAGALSSDPQRARTKGEEFHLLPERCYADFEQMAVQEAQRDDGVEVVMITTPNHLHLAAATAFMKQNIHVMCDKPLVNTIQEAQRYLEIVNQTGSISAVGYVMSCFAMIRQAREIVQSGRLGEINQIHVEFMQDWMTPQNVSEAPHVKWRLDPEQSGRTSCVGDIGTHAAHLAQFVSGCTLTDVRADFFVCGAPKALEDTAFMHTRFDNKIPGTLMATRLAPGNRGGLRLRIYGSEGGLEWDLEQCDMLKVSIFGQPDMIFSRGHGHGISPAVEGLVRAGRGFPEGILEAWANLYTELAVQIGAQKDGLILDKRWHLLPDASDGAEGVRFIEACLSSHQQGGQWMSLRQF